MKRVSLGLLALAVMLTLSGTASAPQQNSATQHQNKDVWLYWYDASDNFYEMNTIAGAEYDLEVEYGVLVDENSAGGTLLAKGYQDLGKPHMAFPLSFLYGHFQ